MMLAMLLKSLVVSTALLPAGSPAKPPALEQAQLAQFVALPPQIRLRKLHLARPDLIPYPIAYEIYC